MFALVDCNNFYASCERLFRPDLQGVPIVVLSNNDGCIIARSAEAKALGIKMGVPFHQCRTQLEARGVRWFSSNYALYGDMSARVMTLLEDKAPRIEVYSIDEAFLDVSELAQHFDLFAYGTEVRNTVWQCTGLLVGVGIAPTKTLAKLANHMAKCSRSGVVVLDSTQQIAAQLACINVGEVWGVGRKLAAHLQAEGIYTAADLSRVDPIWAKRRFSVVLEKTVRELNGLPCLELQQDILPRQQIISSRSFGRRVTDLSELQAAISHHVMRAGEKLRQDGLLAGGIQVSARTGRYNAHEQRYAGRLCQLFPYPTDNSLEMAAIANELVSRIYRSGVRYAKAGVMLLELTSPTMQQPDLFYKAAQHNNDQLMPVLDQLNRRFPGGLTLGRTVGHQHTSGWRMNREYLSPAYTTRWSDLPVVR